MNANGKRAAGFVVAGAAAGLLARSIYDRYFAYSFRDRVVVVTGGSRGLGLVLCRQFAREGARLAICARDRGELDVAAAELRHFGAPVFAAVCDVRDPSQVSHFIAQTRQRLGEVDVLINNAGVIQVGPLETMTNDDFEESLNVHFWAAVNTVNAVLPAMRRRGAGRIVNIASIGGEVVIPHLVPYCAGKFALVGYSQGLRAELAQEGICVTTICPGLMRTGSHLHAQFKGRHREEFTWFSLGGAAPLLTISAERAARQILDACRYGRARVTLSVPAKLLVAADTLLPGPTAVVSGIVNRFLPAAGGIGTRQLPGHASTSEWSPSWLTTLNDRAGRRNNELVTVPEDVAAGDDPVDVASEDSFPASDPPAWTGVTRS